jgi:uncharacterized membrane protein
MTADPAARPLSPALDKTFKIGLVLKGLDGVLEFVGGILLLFLSPSAINHLVRGLTAHELSEDPHDVVARYLVHTAAHLNHGTTLFGAIYLLSHGIAKIVLVALVLRNKLWAYPWLIGLLLAFIVYQLYRITVVHFSAGLTALTIFDAFLVWLTWREYRSKRAMANQPRVAVAGPSRVPAPLPSHSQAGEPGDQRRLSYPQPDGGLPAQREVGEAGDPGDEAVDPEGGQGAGLEVAGQEPDRHVGADAGEQAAEQDLAADAVAERAHQVGDLQGAGGQDHRGGEQEGEPGGVFAGQAPGHAGHHGDPVAADPGQQGEDLRRADNGRLGQAHRGEPPV